MSSARPSAPHPAPERPPADSRGLAAGITSLVTAVLAPVAAMFGRGLAFTAFNMTGGIWTWAGLAGPWPLLG